MSSIVVMEKFFYFLHGEKIHYERGANHELLYYAKELKKALKLTGRVVDICRTVNKKDKMWYRDIDMQVHDYKKFKYNSMFLRLPGLFQVVMLSNQEDAQEFKDWFLGKVLPNLYNQVADKSSEMIKQEQTELEQLRLENKQLKGEITVLRSKDKKRVFSVGIFYIVQRWIYINGERIIGYKIGYTFHFKNRMDTHKRNLPGFKCMSYFVMHGLFVQDLETAMKAILKVKATLLEGTTETFYNIDYEDVEAQTFRLIKDMENKKDKTTNVWKESHDKTWNAKRFDVTFETLEDTDTDIEEEDPEQPEDDPDSDTEDGDDIGQNAVGGHPTYDTEFLAWKQERYEQENLFKHGLWEEIYQKVLHTLPNQALVQQRKQILPLPKLYGLLGEHNADGFLITGNVLDRMYADLIVRFSKALQ